MPEPNNKACVKCGKWEQNKIIVRRQDGLCDECRNEIERKKKKLNVVQCMLEGCENTFRKKNNKTKYCMECRGLNQREKEFRVRQLKYFKEKRQC